MEKLKKEATLQLREKHIGESCILFFASDPLKIVRASGQYMYDEKGTRYLDCINNVCHVGHCHPDVVEAGYQQMKILNTNNRYLHDNIVMLAEKITATMPTGLNVVYVCNSGSEANDLALRLARHHTKATEIITMDHGYHGHVTSTMDISPYKLKNQKDGVHNIPERVHIASCPDVYRGKYRDCDHPGEDMAQLYAGDVKEIINSVHQQEKNVCCFISESMQSCGGQIVFPEGYLKQVYSDVKSAGGVCIADEVQVGFGRVGTHFWAFQTQGVVPDIVTMGKPMGNGHPISAVVTTKAISDSFKKCGMSYFNTFGGNPVSCAIALAVLDVMEKENLLKNAHVVGDYLMNTARDMMADFPLIGDVRGRGLFVGFDLVKNRSTREPAVEEASYILTRMKEKKVIISLDGPHSNVIKFKPPMCFTKEDCDVVLTNLAAIMKEIEQGALTHSEDSRNNNAETSDIIDVVEGTTTRASVVVPCFVEALREGGVLVEESREGETILSFDHQDSGGSRAKVF